MEDGLREIGDHGGACVVELRDDAMAGDMKKNNHEHGHDAQHLDVGASCFLRFVHFVVRSFLFVCTPLKYNSLSGGTRGRRFCCMAEDSSRGRLIVWLERFHT